MLRASHLLLGLAGLLALVGTPGAQASRNICLDACLKPYVDAGTATSQITTLCTRACKAVAKPRKTCLREVNKFWNTQLNTCKKSLRGLKHGQPATSVTATLTLTYTGTPQQTQFQFTFNATCKTDLNTLKADYVQTCKELLCPGNQYWDLDDNACVPPPIPGQIPVATFPATIRGFYKRSWVPGQYQGPPDTNVGVTFTGWFPANDPAQANIPPITNRAINLLSYGGGNQNGAWDLARLQSIYTPTNLATVISLGYNGIVFDIEDYVIGSPDIPPAAWNAAFVAVKAAGLMLVVTISHFAPYGMVTNGQALVADWLQNPHIDVLSPQLYTNGTEPQNDWAGYSAAWKSAVPRVAPVIVQPWYYDGLGANSVLDPQWLPNASGYFVWSDTPALGVGSGVGLGTPCIDFTVGPGTGCAYMCQWCQNNLGTTNYYWTTGVCTYYPGGCQGNPYNGYTYRCCRGG